MNQPDADFDVALSFAGEDRPFVELVAEKLKQSQIRVFYDRDAELYLWGKDLGDTLDEVYRLRSRYVVIFISKHYAGKMWTNHERKSAFARAIQEKQEYVLPARFDNTELPGLLPTTAYIDLRKETAETFASKIIQKVANIEPTLPLILRNGDVSNQNIHMPNTKAWSSNIPSAKGFVGRGSDLQKLDEWYANGIRVFVLHGLGGIGKTALAKRFAENVRNIYDKSYDKEIYLDLQGVNKTPLSPSDIMLEVLRQLDSNVTGGIEFEKLQTLYVSRLNQHRILLLLDNAKDSQQIAPLNKSNNSCLLVTSRKSIFLMGAKTLRIEQMSTEDAKALLFSIADEERFEGYADVLADLAGYLPMALLPLAILLKNNYMESASDLVQKYRDRKKRLLLSNPEYRDNLTVYASFDLSYEVLSDELKKYWRQLAVFPADFHNGGPGYVWEFDSEETIDDILKRLCQYNLLDGNNETKRYRLHDLARDYLSEKIIENGVEELHRIGQRHAEFYALVIKKAYSFIQANRYIDALHYFDNDKINIEAGKKWANDFAEKNWIAAKLCTDYSQFSLDIIILRLHPRKVIELHTAALNSARQLKKHMEEVSALRDLGIVYRSLGEYENAINRYKEALRTLRTHENRRIESEILSNLGLVYCDLGIFSRSATYHKQALKIIREIADPALESKILGNLGLTCRRINPYAATELLEQAVVRAQETKNQRYESIYLGNLGKAYIDLSKFDKAIGLLEQALQLARESSDRESEGHFLGDLGVAYKKSGNKEKGYELLRDSIYILEAIDSPDSYSFLVELEIHPRNNFFRE